MKTKYIPRILKKIPHYLALTLLTAGASLILGFLSFSGMYALSPVLAFAAATFVLSVAYEGEIYLQNIKGALAKLFGNAYIKHRVAQEYLSTHFPDNTDDECPQFFKDYKAQLLLLNQFEHKELSKQNKKRKKQLTKVMKDMELWFAQQLFPNAPKTNKNQSAYALELQKWLVEHEQAEWQKRIKSRTIGFHVAKVFSVLSAVFMGLGSTYLLVEAFSVIPFFSTFAFSPAIILPMAIIAGTAYGLLTYNAVTDLINNNTVLKWYKKLKEDFKQGVTARNVLMAITATFLVTLAVALTVCTAGTWWTIATNARPLFGWMSKMPSFIMGIINPIITGASAIFFNIQNSAESLDMVDEAMRSEKNLLQRMKEAITKGWQHLRNTENWLQILNPFRILLKLTITPLKILLFFGHLLSIALTSDRMPGIPQIVSAIVAIISEGFEDAHYFVGNEPESHEAHDHAPDFKKILKEHLETESGHEHGTDIPATLLQFIAAPIHALAALWDVFASKLNKPECENKALSFKEAWNKQRGTVAEEDVLLSPTTPKSSQAWQVEHVVSLIEQQKKQLGQSALNAPLAEEKIRQLTHLQQTVRKEPHGLQKTLDQEKNEPVYNKHRLFALDSQTSTQKFIEDLPHTIGLTS